MDNRKDKLKRHCLICISIVVLFWAGTVSAQTPSFTYQGRLSDGGNVANGNYDLQFALWDSNSGGTQIGSTQTFSTVAVSAGIFTVQLDFGAAAFPGANRFLEIRARLTGATSFITLSPRQQITSTPYAIRSLNASTADAVIVGGVPSGSGNYIQNNPPAPQAGNFNLSGNGTAGGTLSGNIVNATTQYNLGGTRVLSIPGDRNVYVGQNAGNPNAPSSFGNSFFGSGAGAANTGVFNTFVGESAGALSTGRFNSFFGQRAGAINTEGYDNTFIGFRAGEINMRGSNNTFIGFLAGAGTNPNTDGSDNTVVGGLGTLGQSNLTNATAIGANAQVDQSNALVLGSIAGVNNATSSVNVGIGTTTPLTTLHVNGNALVTIPGGPREVSLGTPAGEAGIGIKGTSNRADLRFDGTTLKLVAGVGTGAPASTSGVAITTAGDVGIGTASPLGRLDIVGGPLRIASLAGGGDEALCRNSTFLTVATCSSSSRYKEGVQPLRHGLNLIQRLRPVTFNWKEGGRADLGLIAEQVAEVEPRLTFKNDKGEIEGVRYDRLNVILINALQQQQSQIASQQLQIEQLQQQQRLIVLQAGRLARQQQQIAKLRRLVCPSHPRASVCK